jgi:hypothetical protein
MEKDHIEVLKDAAELQKLRGFWLACNPRRDADPDLFSFLIEARPQGDRPHVFVLRNGGAPRALLIGRLTRARLPLKIGYFRIPSPELRLLIISNGGWLGEIGEERAALFITALRQGLANGEADAALFHSPELSSPLARQALAQPGFFCRDHLITHDRHRILDLPADDKGFLGSLSQNERYQQRKRERRLAKDFSEVRIDAFTSPESVDGLIAQAETVVRKSYQRQIGVGFAASDFMRARLAFMARVGWLRGFVLNLDGRPGAFWIGTLRNGVFVSDYLAFDPAFKEYAPGMYLILKAIEMLAGESRGPARQIDFGGGDGLYKERLSNRAVEEAQVHIFAPNLRGLTTNVLRSTLGYFNHVLKTQLGNTAWLASAKRTWRARATGPQNRL